MYQININRYVRTDESGYDHLIDIYSEINSLPDKERRITIDFENCHHFHANLSAALGSLLDLLSDRGFDLWITNLRPGVRKALFSNGFLGTIKDYETDKSKEKEEFIRYERFAITESDRFKQYIQDELMRKQKFPKHTTKAGEYIHTGIYEIFANAITHGNCGYVYCCGEYHPDKNPPKLDMTIVDCGETIEKNVNEYFQNKGSQAIFPANKAIEWAIQEGNTTKSITGGLGLAQLMEFLSQTCD